jgi:NAD(P)-dependent dehydrogenase (short-subunit alcohol dehydrogenase family)
VRLAQEGADIVAVDYCTSFDTISYPMATPEDLARTAKEIGALGRRVITVRADVREPKDMAGAVARSLAEFGQLDVVVANAGICAMAAEQPLKTWADVSGVNLGGVLTTLNAALPHVTGGASMIVVGSLAAMRPNQPGTEKSPGMMAYRWAKRTLAGLVHDMALTLAGHMIRVNGVHPTNVDTDMLHHDAMYQAFRPDLEHPAKDDAVPGFATLNAMPTPWVEAEDISNAVLFLASDESKWITGQFLAVDAGGHLKI